VERHVFAVFGIGRRPVEAPQRVGGDDLDRRAVRQPVFDGE
jgi:hypothetical protein